MLASTFACTFEWNHGYGS